MVGREGIREKAQRLLDEGKVHLIGTDSPLETKRARFGIFVVEGDTKAHVALVTSEEPSLAIQRLHAPPMVCSCEARALCSHLLAAHGVFKALTEPGG